MNMTQPPVMPSPTGGPQFNQALPPQALPAQGMPPQGMPPQAIQAFLSHFQQGGAPGGAPGPSSGIPPLPPLGGQPAGGPAPQAGGLPPQAMNGIAQALMHGGAGPMIGRR